MSIHTVPNWINAIRFAKNSEQISGMLALNKLDNLSEVLSDAETELQCQFTFSQNAQHESYLQGQVQGDLHLVCQRCLKTFNYPFESHFDLQLFEDLDEANDLALGRETIIMQEKKISLYQLIEEEILLNLPIAIKHSDAEVRTGECELSLI